MLVLFRGDNRGVSLFIGVVGFERRRATLSAPGVGREETWRPGPAQDLGYPIRAGH